MIQHDDTNETPPAVPSGKLSAQSLRGILIPFPTAFDNAGELDAAALRSNIARWNSTGVSGYVALGSTGERVHLDEREYVAVIETARACVPPGMLFLAGAGQQGTRLSIAEVKRAARAGADAALVITPHLYRGAMTQAALFKHYMAVADAAPVPLVLYNIPQNTGISLAPDTVASLAEHPNIIGIKDSSGDFVNLTEIIRLVHADFAVLTGHAALLYAALASGARGAILAAACAAPELCVGVFRAFETKADERARHLQRRLAPLARAVTTQYGVGGLKVALDAGGYAGGRVRAPLEMPSEEAQREIARLVEASRTPADESADAVAVEIDASAQPAAAGTGTRKETESQARAEAGTTAGKEAASAVEGART